jgi:D-alanyl-lipoteichoic acid acyltransferase DltB (MBOAT superfamily)
MLFPTLNFGLFFLVVFTISWLLHRRAGTRIVFLIVASYVFYAVWDWRFCGLLFASSTANWGFGRLIYRLRRPTSKQWIVALAITANLLTLGFFKYCNFFIGSANGVLEWVGGARDIPYLRVVLPVGISFFTFHGISYVVDIYRGKLARPASYQQMLLYISFFPQLVAGPIIRASHFLPQLAVPVDPDDIRATRAFLLILGGLFKKVVVANYLSTDLVDDVFFDPSRFGAADLLLASYGYAVQIYCDFSAYTDIAIGVAALFGYRFPQNFDQPYRSLGMRDFWQRWHISLSSWLRDYLYISLGGNTGDWRRYRNLMITMLLGGLWHGAAWNFVIWGGLHGAMLVGEHFLWPNRKAMTRWPIWARALGIVVTFHLTCLTWIFFRAPDLDHAFGFLGGFSALTRRPTMATPFIMLLLVGALGSQFLPADRMERIEHLIRRIPLALQGALVGAGIVAIDSLGPSGIAPFIYFQF